MNVNRIMCASTLVAGIGIAGLLGAGTAGLSRAAERRQKLLPASRGLGPQNNGPVDWQRRDINQGRQDHQPFQYNGQQVWPARAGNGDGWGFWFLGQWIKL